MHSQETRERMSASKLAYWAGQPEDVKALRGEQLRAGREALRQSLNGALVERHVRKLLDGRPLTAEQRIGLAAMVLTWEACE